ncbi:hypothetical protein DF184_08820 [Streptococcus suis]|nr:hypothetical protein DF184_08820 [Streptococcus suis]MBS8100924.1 hypothetical protein [Streptococcus suis]
MKKRAITVVSVSKNLRIIIPLAVTLFYYITRNVRKIWKKYVKNEKMLKNYVFTKFSDKKTLFKKIL